jgi:hypothetical protein
MMSSGGAFGPMTVSPVTTSKYGKDSAGAEARDTVRQMVKTAKSSFIAP